MDSEGILDPDAQRTSDSESITRKGDAPVLADRTSKLVNKDGDFVHPMMISWFKLLDNQVGKLWIQYDHHIIFYHGVQSALQLTLTVTGTGLGWVIQYSPDKKPDGIINFGVAENVSVVLLCSQNEYVGVLIFRSSHSCKKN